MTIAVTIQAETDTSTPPLSALEWKVVSLAMREAAESRRHGWFGRLVEGSGGVRPKLPLADPRLETLRRFVGRVRDRADASDLKHRLVEFGFHPNQVKAVAMIAR